jgi:hypothetical protein
MSSAEFVLEEALAQLLGRAGELGLDHHHGPGLAIDLLLYDGEDVGRWAARLAGFLRDCGVPRGTALSLTTLTGDGPIRHWRIEVPVK